MKIDFFHERLKAKKIERNLLLHTKSILRSGQYTNGKYVKQFEDKFSRLNKAKYCVSVNTGTSALHLGLLSLGIKPGDEVILPSISFIASAAAVKYVGAEPVFVDVSNDDWFRWIQFTLQSQQYSKLVPKQSISYSSPILFLQKPRISFAFDCPSIS